jgi:hypothetical protein
MLPITELSVTVQRTTGSLELSLPLPAPPGNGQSFQMLQVRITPLVASTSDVDFDIRFEAKPPSEGPLDGFVFDRHAAKRELIKAFYDLPRWLEWLDVVIQTR